MKFRICPSPTAAHFRRRICTHGFAVGTATFTMSRIHGKGRAESDRSKFRAAWRVKL
jgi:glycerol dehydrogenase-like iron-containing ADH family enzyme